MKILRYLSALSLAAGPSFAQRDVEDLFQVNFGTNNLGGCGYVGRDRMNMALRDSLNLVNAGIRLIDEIDQAPDAQRLAEAFWRGSNQAQRTIIRRKYEAVGNWLVNGGPVNGGQFTGIPRLFCHHGWLRRQAMSDSAYDAQGDPYNNFQDMTVRIQDNPFYVQRQANQAQALQLDISQIYPYWALVGEYYIFDERYSPGANTGFCSPGGARTVAGVTYHFLVSSITLCPYAFGTTNSRPSGWAYRGLRSTSPNPVTLEEVRTSANQNMQRFTEDSGLYPTATALFHELFHLVLGNDPGVTNPVTQPREIYSIDDMLNALLVDSMANPHSYATAAIAYDYTVNSGDVDGWRVELFTGFTTQGPPPPEEN